MSGIESAGSSRTQGFGSSSGSYPARSGSSPKASSYNSDDSDGGSPKDEWGDAKGGADDDVRAAFFCLHASVLCLLTGLQQNEICSFYSCTRLMATMPPGATPAARPRRRTRRKRRRTRRKRRTRATVATARSTSNWPAKAVRAAMIVWRRCTPLSAHARRSYSVQKLHVLPVSGCVSAADNKRGLVDDQDSDDEDLFAAFSSGGAAPESQEKVREQKQGSACLWHVCAPCICV